MHVNGIEEAEKTIREFLPQRSNVILVGYSLSTELRWMVMECPALMKSFTAWVDVQELVKQHLAVSDSLSHERIPPLSLRILIVEQEDVAYSPDTPSKDISLRAALHAMKLKQTPNDTRRHRAANDACRALQVLAGLLISRPFTLAPSHKPDSIHIQPVSEEKLRYPTALWITASNGAHVPRRTPAEVAHMYQKFGIVAAGAYQYRSKHSITGKPKRTRYWWLAFQDQEQLEKCRAEVDGSVVDGSVLMATEELEFRAGLKSGRQHVQQEREEARSTINAFEMADLFDHI